MIDYAIVLVQNYPNDKWTLNGSSYEGLVWLSNTPKPSKEELDLLWSPIEVNLINKQVNEKRHLAYVNESDPLFFKAQRGEATMEEWQAKISEIKNRYPKT